MKVLNFGSLGIDYVFSVAHFVRPGETILTDDRQIFPGGKGLNQSIALAKAGVEVCQAGAIGEADGQFLINVLEENGIDCKWVYRNPHTGSQNALIQVVPEGQNSILLYGGANRQISREVAAQTLEGFESGDYLILQNEISCVGEIMELAAAKGMKIVFNPSPLSEEMAGYPLDQVDMFLLNEIEGEDLSGCEDRQQMIYGLQKRFPKAQVILTLGKEGCMYLEPGMDKPVIQKAFRVEAVDTTAAGDTFTGYVLAGLIKGRGIQESLRLACAASAISVTRAGASASIPEQWEVEAFLVEQEMKKEENREQ